MTIRFSDLLGYIKAFCNCIVIGHTFKKNFVDSSKKFSHFLFFQANRYMLLFAGIFYGYKRNGKMINLSILVMQKACFLQQDQQY